MLTKTSVQSRAPLAAESSSSPVILPVAVLGAGPVGLAAAAKLIERGIPFIVLEAAEKVGANLLDFGHVRLFSPWRFNVDSSMAKLLESSGWRPPEPNDLPLARDIVGSVLQPFADLPQIAPSVSLGTRVVAISREGFDKVKSEGRSESPFVIRAIRDDVPVEIRARAVIDATGTWSMPNPLGANGLPAIGERESAGRIFYGIPDVLGKHRSRYEGKRTLVVGSGHSAANALLSLSQLAEQTPTTRLVWAVRSPVMNRLFGGGAGDALPARGALGSSLRRLRDAHLLEFVSGLRIEELRLRDKQLVIAGIGSDGQRLEMSAVDEIICATGQRPDLSVTSELRVRLDSWLESTEALGPFIDPNVHSCGTVRPHGHRELAHPEPGLYTVGVKSYGRAPTFLMTTGFEQVRSVVAAIAGDLEAADRVELELPETGVCGIGKPKAAASCGAPVGDAPPSRSTGCGARKSDDPARQPVASCCG